MERIELLLQLVLLLSLYYLRAESHGSLFVSKLKGPSCSVEEREALLNFKQSLYDPDRILSSWIAGEDCCAWKGVGCSNTTGHVTKLDLTDIFGNDSYATSLDPILFRLQHLQYLSLSGIYFNESSIPPSIDSLSNLLHLNLSYSGFGGVLPSHFGNLTKLRYLDLSYNDVMIDMSLDKWLFHLKHLQYLNLCGVYFKQENILQKNFSLVHLRYLYLCDSNLEGEISPQLGNLTNLHFLDLHDNSLVASNLIWMSQLSSLQYLDMSDVNLTLATNWLYEINVLPALSNLYLSNCNLHTLPTLHTYANFSSTITSIDLSFNLLHGSMPNWLGHSKKLNSLNLESNKLTGPISSAFFSLLYNLNILYLSENNFTKLIDDGSILKYNQYKITDMDISNNQLSGSIPEWVGQMKDLIWLNLGNNQLSGSIPMSFGQLSNLNSLDLSFNLLNGSVSNVIFANLSKLNYLYLTGNHLNFSMISFNWIPPFQLYDISLRSCIIGPQFPLWLQNQRSLINLDLSNSRIAGIIPSWFWNISSQTSYLNLSHNAIRGELPVLLNVAQIEIIDLKSNLLEGRLPYVNNFMLYVSFSNNMFSSGIEKYINASVRWLGTLDLSRNNLSGEISDSICQMPFITQLDLSYNNLSGQIPKCKGEILSFMQLTFISLTHNKFSGSIPQWMGNLPNVLSLYLSNNNFHGEIPFFKNSSKLITLDMGQNKLTGNIPSWIGDRLVSLKILSLRSNKLQGLIPFELSKLEELQILDLADNFLSGPLPKSFKFLNAMTVQNRSLTSMTPQYDSNFTWQDSLMIHIKGLDLEYTDVLSLVTTMDLSCNNLTGEVPIELMSLIGLISLNLSRNQFTGQIPINIGVMQSLESLDLSRNYFTGEIPMSIVNLNYLEFLNLSYNQLSGRIPMGTQLNTFHESSYYENSKLCGKPLLKTCEGDDQDIDNGKINSYVVDDENFDLFLGMGVGFVVGLWSVLGTLLLNKSLALAYFQLYYNITNNIYIFVAIRVNRWFNQ